MSTPTTTPQQPMTVPRWGRIAAAAGLLFGLGCGTGAALALLLVGALR